MITRRDLFTGLGASALGLLVPRFRAQFRGQRTRPAPRGVQPTITRLVASHEGRGFYLTEGDPYDFPEVPWGEYYLAHHGGDSYEEAYARALEEAEGEELPGLPDDPIDDQLLSFDFISREDTPSGRAHEILYPLDLGQPRPPLAQGRLEIRGDGKVKWSLRRPWRDGTRAFVFDPMTFLERLVALVPHPREHQLTYFGVLAPASPLRDAVVPARPPTKRDPDAGEPAPCTHSARLSWPELLSRTFGEDVLRCPRCQGRRHQIATITDPLVARKILAHLGLRSEPPALAPARPPPQAQMRFE